MTYQIPFPSDVIDPLQETVILLVKMAVAIVEESFLCFLNQFEGFLYPCPAIIKIYSSPSIASSTSEEQLSPNSVYPS